MKGNSKFYCAVEEEIVKTIDVGEGKETFEFGMRRRMRRTGF